MRPKEKLLFLGVDSSTEAALAYAKELGVSTVITDYYGPEKEPLKSAADDYWMIDVTDLDLLEETCKKEGITGIFAGNHELCLDMAGILCKKLGFPFYCSEKAWEIARDKSLFKDLCLECGLDVPPGYETNDLLQTDIPKKIKYPVVVKPSDASSQKGFSVCRDETELETGYRKALNYSDNKSIIIEQYMEGLEIDILYYVDDGVPHLISISDNLPVYINDRWNFCMIPNQSRFFDLYVEEMSEKIEKLIQKIDYCNGGLLFQAIVQNGKFYFIEMAVRLDGAGCWYNAAACYGFNILHCMVNLALGRKNVIKWKIFDFHPNTMRSAIYFVWGIPGQIAAIEGVDALNTMEGVSVILDRFKTGDIIEKTDNMTQIAWYLSITADSTETLIEKVHLINNTLKIYDENGRNLAVYYDDFNALEKY